MDEKLRQAVQEGLGKKESPAKLRTNLIESGFAEHEVDEALRDVTNEHVDRQDKNDKHNSRLLAVREFIDRVGYGAAAPQFINILFFQTGAGLFLLGLFNGLRTVISMLITAVMQEYAKVHKVSKNTISAAGILFGFSFLIMAFARRGEFVWLFAIGLLLAGLGVVTYGDLYNKLVVETIRREKMGRVLRRMGKYGVLITMIAMLGGAWILDYFPDTTAFSFQFWGMTFHPVGYLLAFEVTAFAFIISGYLLTLLKGQREERHYGLGRFIKEHCSALHVHAKSLFKNRYIKLLIFATTVTGLLEVLGQSYYGLFIYQRFQTEVFGGFLNVAVLYGIAIVTSFMGPWFTKKLQRSIGLSPMLVFGTLLTAILPFTLVYNAHILSVAAALIFSVIGAAIVGFAQGLLARKLMDEETRKKYFMSLGLYVALPYLILVPVGAWLAHTIGMEMLFLIVGLGLVLVVAPLYFILVAMANKERL